MDDFADLMAELLPEGWELYEPEMGMESLLLAPCGNVTEQDGTCCCPEKHESPLRGMGLI